MDLTTRYMGLDLKNPLVASASPLNAELGNIQCLEDSGAAAIVLPSIFEEQIEAEMQHHVFRYGIARYGMFRSCASAVAIEAADLPRTSASGAQSQAARRRFRSFGTTIGCRAVLGRMTLIAAASSMFLGPKPGEAHNPQLWVFRSPISAIDERSRAPSHGQKHLNSDAKPS